MLEVKDINFPSVHSIHFPSLGLSLLLRTVGGWPFKVRYRSNALWFLERKTHLTPKVTAGRMVTHKGSDFREKCSFAHSFSHPFIQQLVSAFHIPDTKDELEVQQGLGPQGAFGLMRVKHSKTWKGVQYNGVRCRVIACSGSW